LVLTNKRELSYKVGVGNALGRASKKLPGRVRKSGKAGYVIR
jgi:hypothetical protein